MLPTTPRDIVYFAWGLFFIFICVALYVNPGAVFALAGSAIGSALLFAAKASCVVALVVAPIIAVISLFRGQWRRGLKAGAVIAICVVFILQQRAMNGAPLLPWQSVSSASPTNVVPVATGQRARGSHP